MENAILIAGIGLAANGVWQLLRGRTTVEAEALKSHRHEQPSKEEPEKQKKKKGNDSDGATAATPQPPPEEEEEKHDMEDFELPEDVYACAFVLANNATPGMYSFSPLVS